MTKCKNCGTEFDSKFCPNCGAPVDEHNESAADGHNALCRAEHYRDDHAL